MALIDEIEWVSGRLDALLEAESIVMEGAKYADFHSRALSLLSQTRAIYDESMKEFLALARKAAGVGKAKGLLSGTGRIPLEAPERYFGTLRLRAEAEWARSHRLTGKEAARSRKIADMLADLTRQAALALRKLAEDRKVWTPEYIKEHELGSWV